MDPSEVVLEYLRVQNRPYSTNDIFNNLHEEIKKPTVQKALDHLAKTGAIIEKAYGKQKVYVVKQEDTNVKNFEQELQDLDSKFNEISQKLASAEQELKSNEKLLCDLQSAPTTNAAECEQKLLESRIEVLKAKFDNISKNTVNISESDSKQKQKDHESNVKELRKRRRLCMDIIESILEFYPNSKRALLDEVGIETDEDVGMPLNL
ncbi:homologous-pairing protein 2 homolog [Zootermopsis nevadensis]|uniref:Homologous-pairing protein 2 homolog n=1 Tax=Zootermopsis nevadensis TaxID=136037 RepID=A0A067R752_ZOONE|nr:homologous-pairing protein 2 homolog [Zootermopsis nevadensis]KDR15309.1 Homologous-pairing protein 2-like protein [Zootermopsis nevadensis]